MDPRLARTRLLAARRGLTDYKDWALDDMPGPGPESEGDLDQHSADSASYVKNRTDDEGYVDTAEQQIAEIDAALRRIADGTWGTCVICGRPIDDERLEARPQACSTPRPRVAPTTPTEIGEGFGGGGLAGVLVRRALTETRGRRATDRAGVLLRRVMGGLPRRRGRRP